SLYFNDPGTYQYISAVDCTNSGGTTTPGFMCGAILNVTDSGMTYNAMAQNTPTPVPTPIPGIPPSVTVHVTDTGFDPPTITVALGGSVTWINDGLLVHTAKTTGGGNPAPFDTGGLASALSASFTFASPGTYTYTSSIDCGNAGGAPAKGFDCGPYTVVVSPQPSVLSPAPSAAAVA